MNQTKAYKTVLRVSGETYQSIDRAIAGQTYLWHMGITRQAPGGANHADWLFAYPTIAQALQYGSNYAPSGEVVLLECEVTGKKCDGKLFCTAIKPLREIPIRRDRAAAKGIRMSHIAGGRAPIIRVNGNQSPELRGESYYWTTPSGKTRVEHPKAYGWPTVYHHSTRRIEVGVDWAPLAIDRDAVYSDDMH